MKSNLYTWDKKIIKLIKRYGKIIWAIIFISIVIIYKFGLPSPECRVENRYKSDSYNGVIIKKFIDHDNHNYRTLVLKNGRKIVIIEKSGFFNYVQIGDSINKVKGNLEIQTFRHEEDTTFLIDCGCDEN